MEEPLAAERWRYEPDFGKPAPPDTWNVITNFVEPKDMLRRFGVWPDDVLTPESLQALYSGKSCGIREPFSAHDGQGSRPLFPFLDEAEEATIAGIWECRKGLLTSVLMDGLARVLQCPDTAGRTSANPGAGWVLLVLQTMVILELREREMESGIWEERTPGQKMGTVFAMRPGMTTKACRVQAIPLVGDSVLCMPWGGHYGEYSKILPLVLNRYTRQVIESANEDLEVVPEGHVLKLMVAAGLLRELGQSWMDSHWVLSLPVIGAPDALRVVQDLSVPAREISAAIAPDISLLVAKMRSGRYGYLEGHGDYLEMAYQVLLGLLCQWAAEQGLLSRSPRFRVTGRGPVVERPRTVRDRGAWVLPGVAVVRGAAAAWNSLTTVSASRGSESAPSGWEGSRNPEFRDIDEGRPVS